MVLRVLEIFRVISVFFEGFQVFRFLEDFMVFAALPVWRLNPLKCKENTRTT
jgi:hypothetical protein